MPAKYDKIRGLPQNSPDLPNERERFNHPELFAIKKTLQISKNGELRNFMKLSPARTRGYLIKGQATTG